MPAQAEPTTMIGQTFGHYRIVEKIGSGGMGEVYRAHDERLDRDVALKVLPAGALTDEAARKRLRKEALNLSKLNHPNIATIHDFDTQDGVDFLVMEYVAGTSLAQKLSGGSLPEKQLLALGTQLAQALEEAHERGVVHRDLKPGNVMIAPGGWAKVLDFGLAKQLRPVTEKTTIDSLNESRVVAGTLPYMAPEQLLGEATDARTDIYGLGALLYEMATGQKLFREALVTRLADAILHQAPVPPHALSSHMSPELERIILKCLEKEPEDRYQSAKELNIDLRRLLAQSSVRVPRVADLQRASWRWTVATAVGVVLIVAVAVGLAVHAWRGRLTTPSNPPEIQSLAVLPFENLSGEPQQEYFAEGMSDALITDLSQIKELRVISRTSVTQYKGTHKPVSEIAKELHVDGIVEGSVLRVGDRVRISTELVRAETERNLWAQQYEREFTNVLSLQNDVARDIVSEIQIRLTPQEQTRLSSSRPIVPEAYEAYLQGRYDANKRTGEALTQAVKDYRRSINLDATYAPAYAGLAGTLALLTDYTDVPPAQVLPDAEATARRALQLDDSLAEAHASLGLIRFWLFEWSGVLSEYQRAIQLNPGYANAHHWYALFLSETGKSEEGIAEIKLAQELDPRSLIINANMAWCFYLAGKYDQAIEQAHKTLELDPSFAVAHEYLGQAHLEKGKYEESFEELRMALSLSGNETLYKAELANAYAVAGRRENALELLRDLLQRSSRQYVSPYSVALVYAGLGDTDQAFNWLNRAYKERDARLTSIKVHPRFASLRPDPRFKALVAHINP
jgi:eukaryotic-like serine/threonine-protein kinase